MIPLPYEPRRVLIIKPSALGDVVHTLPILRLLKRRFPAAEISWLVNPGFADIIRGNRDIAEVIPFDRTRFARAWRSTSAAGALMRFREELRGRRFDLAIDLQGLFRSGWLTGCTAAPVRLGFGNAREMAQVFYSHRVPIRSTEVHAIERYLTLVESLGCARGPIEFDFAVPEADRRSLDGKLDEAGIDRGRYAVLLPGTNWPTKRWPPEQFARVADALGSRLGLTPVVAGGDDTPAIPGAVSLIGRTNLKELVVLLESASIVVANDTGPMHIAAALGRPLVTPFGPTNPVRTGPFRRMDSVVRLNLPCSPCYERQCSHQSCLRWLDADHVLAAVTRQMSAC